MRFQGIRIAGALFIVVALLMSAAWTGLMAIFDYPDILREPVSVILTRYADGGVSLRLYWAGLTLGSLLLVPAAVLFYLALRTNQRAIPLTGMVFGVLTALFHLLGFSRWLFTVDELAKVYANPLSTEAQREAAGLVFSAFHSYLGVTLGETLGFLTMGIWAAMVGINWLQLSSGWKWWGILAILAGLGIMTGVLEWGGWKAAVEVNAYAYQVWIVLLIVLGVRFMLRPRID